MYGSGYVLLAFVRASLVDPLTIAIALGALLVLARFKLNSTWLIVGGAALGLLGAFFK